MEVNGSVLWFPAVEAGGITMPLLVSQENTVFYKVIIN